MASNENELPSPGHFNLPLPIATEEVVKANAGYKHELLEKNLEQSQNYCANCNLLGVLASTKGYREEALRYFEMALKEDPENLNAVANINHVNRHSSSEEGKPIPRRDISSRAGKLQQARCYAEQGYSYVQLYHNTVKDQRYDWYNWAVRLYKEAIILASRLVDRATRQGWLFSSGLASVKILEIAVNKKNDLLAKEALGNAAGRFGAIVDSPSADKAMKSKVLMHVAVAFYKASRLMIDRQYIPKSLVKYIARPEECLNEARHLSPDDALTAKILVRLAQMRRRPDRGGTFGEALQLLNKSITLDSSKFNFLAYSSRASLRINRYKDTSELDLELITEARKDLEFILPKHKSPWDFEWLAEVYYYLAKQSAGTQFQEHIRKALAICTNCERCQDGAERSGLHHVRGKILSLNGQDREALESFQKGVGCEEKTGWISGNLPSLHKLRKHIEDQEAAAVGANVLYPGM